MVSHQEVSVALKTYLRQVILFLNIHAKPREQNGMQKSQFWEQAREILQHQQINNHFYRCQPVLASTVS